MFKGSTVYLSGKINGDPDFKVKFAEAKKYLIDQGAKLVINPAELPDGWEYQHYMAACMALIPMADTLAQLPCWVDSPGAKAEAAYCHSLKIPVFNISDYREANNASMSHL